MPLDTHASLANLDLHEAKRIKIPVRAASTANVSLTAPGATIDGVTLVANDRVLLKNQTTASQNGIYVWTGAAATLTRATDANSAPLLFFGFLVYVREGTANGGTLWMFTQSAAVTLETTALTFSAVGATNLAGEMTAADFNVTGLTGATAGMRLVGATASSAPTTGTFAVGDVVEDRAAGGFWGCTVAGTPGTWVRTGFANPMTTVGDLIVGGTAGAATRLAAGTATNVLTANGPGVSPTWQPAPAGGGGGGTGGGSGNPVSNSLAADVSMPTANVFVDGPILTLTPGTWNLEGQVTCVNATAATDFTAKLWDGTNVVDTAQASSRTGNVGVSMPVSGAVVVSATTTFKISVAGNNASCTIKAAATVNPAGNNASTLTATPAGSPAPGNTSNALYQQTKIRGTGNKTTTSTTFVALDATNLPPLSLTLSSGDIVRCILMCESATASGSGAMFDFQVVQPTLGTARTNPTAAGGATTNADLSHIPTTVIATFTAAETGVHTFQPVWATAVAAVTITVFNATTPVDQDVEVLFSIEKLAPTLAPAAGGGTGVGGGAIVPIQIQQLSASAATVTFAVPQTFRNLRLVWQARGDTVAVNTQLRIQFNSDATANYDSGGFFATGTPSSGGTGTGNGAGLTSGTIADFTAASAPAGASGTGEAVIPNYTNTTFRKSVTSNLGFKQADTAAGTLTEGWWTEWRSTAAITSITLFPGAGNFIAGTVFALWGEADLGASLPAANASLIQEVVLGAAAANIPLNNIPQSYRDLRIVVQARGDVVANDADMRLQFNGDTTASYDWERLETIGAGSSSVQGTADTALWAGFVSGASSPASTAAQSIIDIANYAATTFQKATNSRVTLKIGTVAGSFVLEEAAAHWRNTGAITSILLFPATGNFVAGTVVRLYGEPATPLPKIAEVVLGVAQASVTFSAIPQTYRALRVDVHGRLDTAAVANSGVGLQFNGDTAANYDWTRNDLVGALNSSQGQASTSAQVAQLPAATATAGVASGFTTLIRNYVGTVFQKECSATGSLKTGTAASQQFIELGAGFWRSTAAITSLTVLAVSGNLLAGSTVTLYGEP